MKKILRISLFVLMGLAFFACSDDDDGDSASGKAGDTTTTDYGAAAAIAEIGEKYASKDLTGNEDVSSFTFSSFSNAGGDPLYVREGEVGSYTWRKATETDKSSIFTRCGFVFAENILIWTRTANDSLAVSHIGVNFNGRKIFFNNNVISEISTSGTVDLKKVRAFFALRAPADGTVTAKLTNYSVKVDSAVVALVNQNGKILDGITLTPKSDTVTPDAQTLSANVSAGDVVFIVKSNNSSDDNSGTVNLNSFVFEQGVDSVDFNGTYKGTMTSSTGNGGNSGTIYIVVEATNGSYTFKGYTSSDYTAEITSLNESGTYTVSGNTVTIDAGFTYKTSDGGKTWVLTSCTADGFGDVTSSVTKQ